MASRLKRALLFVLYQLTLLVGILALPVALVASKLGIRLPLHRAVTRLGDAYENVGTA